MTDLHEKTGSKKNKHKIVKYCVAGCLMVGAIIFLFFGPTAVRQGINLRKAREHNNKLEKLFATYAEFKNIKAHEGTGGGGCIILTGEVENEESAALLKKIVSDSNPPVKVIYLVTNKETDSLIGKKQE